jgi:hypothetical protein
MKTRRREGNKTRRQSGLFNLHESTAHLVNNNKSSFVTYLAKIRKRNEKKGDEGQKMCLHYDSEEKKH